MNLLLYVDALDRRAGLAAFADPCSRCVGGAVEVGVGAHDHRGLPPSSSDTGKPLRCARSHLPPGTGRSSEHDHVDVIDECRRCHLDRRDEQHVLRQACFAPDCLHHHRCRQRWISDGLITTALPAIALGPRRQCRQRAGVPGAITPTMPSWRRRTTNCRRGRAVRAPGRGVTQIAPCLALPDRSDSARTNTSLKSRPHRSCRSRALLIRRSRLGWPRPATHVGQAEARSLMVRAPQVA